jgi:hypothetical protein
MAGASGCDASRREIRKTNFRTLACEQSAHCDRRAEAKRLHVERSGWDFEVRERPATIADRTPNTARENPPLYTNASPVLRRRSLRPTRDLPAPVPQAQLNPEPTD